MNYYFTFRSITRAQLAMRYLQAADMTAGLMRTPKVLAREGCGYAIRVRDSDVSLANQIFQENEIQYHRRFVEQNGRFQEA